MAIRNGTSGDDTNLHGTKHDDQINGKAGFDVLYGLKGNDRLNGGADDDLLYGGRGHDTFVFKTGGGEDQIDDFKLGKDGLDVHKTTFGKDDLKDVQNGGNGFNSDSDGNYCRQTSANGHPEVQLYFATDHGFNSLTIEGITLKQLRMDVKDHPGHYDFF